MKRRFLAGLAAAAAVTASVLMVSGADAATPDATAAGAQSAGVTPDANAPEDIQVGEGFKIVASLRGVGKQIYDCNGRHVHFREPAAGLFTSRGVPAAIHGKGPFWTNFDGSRVDGKATKSSVVRSASADPTKNVPWLKLVATPTPNTTGVFSNVAFIQRIDTRGGVAPTERAPRRRRSPSTTSPTTCSGRKVSRLSSYAPPASPTRAVRLLPSGELVQHGGRLGFLARLGDVESAVCGVIAAAPRLGLDIAVVSHF